MKSRDNHDAMNNSDKVSMLRTAIYLRVNRGPEEERSLQAQREACVQQANADGAEGDSADIYEDRASGMDRDRTALNQLRQAVRAGKVSAVYVQSADRLSRNSRHLFSLRHEFALAGVLIHFVHATASDQGENSIARWNSEIRAMFRMAADGWSLLDIAILANTFEVPTLVGEHWTVASVQRLLENGTK